MSVYVVSIDYYKFTKCCLLIIYQLLVVLKQLLTNLSSILHGNNALRKLQAVTGSPAGLSRVNGVCRSSAKTWNSNPSPKSQFYINWFHIWRGWLRYGGNQPCHIWFGSDERLRRHMGATYTGPVTVLFFFVFLFFDRATDHTHEPIFVHNSSKDAVWCKEDLFGDEKCVFLKFGGVLPKKHP